MWQREMTNSYIRRIPSAYWGYGLAKLLPGLLILMAVPLWLRIFGSDQYGLYSALWTLVVVSGSISAGWLRQAVLRYSGFTDLDLTTLPKWTVPLVALISISPLPVVLIAGGLELSLQETLVGSVFSLFNVYYTLALARAQRLGKARKYAAAETVRIASALVASLALGLLPQLSGASAILAGYAIGTVLALMILKAPKNMHSGSYYPEHVLLTFWRYGWPMSIWLGLSTLLVYVDRLIVVSILDSGDAGNYAAISDLVVRGFSMAAFPVTMTAHPIIMAQWNRGDHHGALHSSVKFTNVLVLYTVLGVALVSVFGEPLLSRILGIVVPSPFLIPTLCIGAALWQIALMAHKVLELTKHTLAMVLWLLLALTVSVTLSISLTAQYGVLVPAVSLAVGAALYVAGTFLHGVSLAREIGGARP